MLGAPVITPALSERDRLQTVLADVDAGLREVLALMAILGYSAEWLQSVAASLQVTEMLAQAAVDGPT